MLAVSRLSVQFGGRYLFDDISFQIGKNDRIGLVGKNGAGKSTLLKILAGKQSAESGNVSKPGDYTIGYLPQDMEHKGGRTVFQEALTAFTRLQALQVEMDKLSDQISHATDTASDAFMDLLTRLHDAQEKFGMLGGYDMESETEKILLGLGFMRADFDRATETFSGGWRMRVELAKILLQRPDLLLLDEPTNHLDIESIQWLENFLKTYSGALVMVSHDRVFLDTVTNRTIEITLGKIYDYKSSYSRYVELRAERNEQLQSTFENQQKKIAEMERFVERFKAKASKATQAQSRVKMLEKMDRIELEDEDVAAMRFRFPDPPRAGRMIVEAKHIRKQYGDKLVLKDINFELERGDKVAFVGKNGEGKSTLSKIIAGLEPSEGEYVLGHNVHLGYYAQNQADALDGTKTVFETIDDAAVGEMRTKVRSLLGAFLFSGEAIDKKVKVLSGGEKARLALCKLLLEPVNLLIMDEPTNHLDMRSKDLLKEALMNYTGSLIIVSHDRDFLQGLTQKVFEFRNQAIRVHLGDVYEYLRTRKLESLDALNEGPKTLKAETPPAPAPVQSQPKAAPAAPAATAPAASNLSREERRAMENKRKKLERSIETAEAEVGRLETEVARLEAELYKPESASRQTELLAEHQKAKSALDKAMSEWENLQLELDSLG